MKNFLILCSFLMCVSIASAQSKTDVTLCSIPSGIEVSKHKIFECGRLIVNSTEYKVKSFKASVSYTNDEGESIVEEISFQGNRLDEKFKALKAHNPKKLYIDGIVLMNEKGETMDAKSLVYTLK